MHYWRYYRFKMHWVNGGQWIWPRILNHKTNFPKKSLMALYEMELLVSDMNETIILPGEFYDLSALNLSYQLNISKYSLS